MDQLDAIEEAKSAGATEEDLKMALEMQRKTLWRLDFIAAENSMGFLAPQEAARILGEAVALCPQGSNSGYSLARKIGVNKTKFQDGFRKRSNFPGFKKLADWVVSFDGK